ncbi:MAG: hypothetical protein V2I25_08170 [Woeseiaceae bacterium]|nr:hypothetical protein [Woeseiaceae bacterium]
MSRYTGNVNATRRIRCGRRFCLVALLLAAMPCAADDVTPLFSDTNVITAELAGPFRTLLKDSEQRGKHAMTLRVGDHALDVEVRIRGKSRARICRFPPLRVYFTGDTAGTPFDGQDSLKLVTHCFNNDRGERNVIEEYAAYRVLNTLTEASYRTRGLATTYTDTEDKLPKAARQHFAFFLETRGQLAKRLDADKADIEGVRLSQLDTQQAAIVFVFQYLIGNTDWSLARSHLDDECCHNVDLLLGENGLIAVPYDFDQSGMVNASYAKPDPSLHLRRVTIRRYRGYCIDPAAVRSALLLVRDRRDAINAALRDIPIASDRHIEDILDYLEPAFREAEDADELLEDFAKRCL